MKILIAIIFIMVISGCANIEIPEGQENKRTFTQQSEKPYKEAYRIIAKQMRACYRAIGIWGNGYEVQADLDTENKQGIIEVYYIGFTGAQKPEDSIFSRTVTITESSGSTMIKTTGTTPEYVYLTHKAIPNWLRGIDSCAP